MNYPLISEYIEAIKAAEDNFEQLKNLRPVLDDDGQLVMTSGNFAVVFKMKDEQTGKLHAVKCFLKEQEGRAEAYRQIAEELEYVSSTFLTPIKYLDKELFVDTSNSDENEYPVLLMDWVDGKTLDKYILEHIDDEYELSLLAYQFSRLAMWLQPQPFAHGDLKPDNILVKEDGTLALVDYDGMYVPAMKGQKARELGSPDFRHPSRTEYDFDEHIDDFSLVSILLSLKAIALKPDLLAQYGASDRLLFSEKDYRNLSESQVMDAIKTMMQDSELATLYSLFILSSAQKNLSQTSFRLLNLSRPKEQEMTDEEIDAWIRAWEEERAPYDVAETWPFDSFVKEYDIISFQQGYPYYSVTDGGEDGFFFKSKSGKIITVFNQCGVTKENILTQKDNLLVELRKSGHYILCSDCKNLSTAVTEEDLTNAWIDEFGVKYSADRKRLLLIPDDITDYKIRRGTIVICDEAFGRPNIYGKLKNNLQSLFLPDSIRIITSWGYFAGQHLNKIVVDEKNPIFDSRANCNAIIKTSNNELLLGCQTTVIPNDISIISVGAFASCINLESIIIPNSVSRIGEMAFVNCEKLKEIHIPASVNEIGNRAFNGCDVKSIIVDKDNKVYDSRDNCNAIILSRENKLVFGCKNTIIPTTITTIGDSAFECCDLKKIEIPHNILKIEAWAFSHCADLESITFPSSLISIGKGAFWGCGNLTSIIYSNSVEEIGSDAFSGCGNIEQILIPGGTREIFEKLEPGLSFINKLVEQEGSEDLSTEVSEKDLANAWTDEFGVKYSKDRKRLLKAPDYLKKYVIERNTIVICDDAFKDCELLSSLTIPKGVRSIGQFVFCNCISLTSLTIPNGLKKISYRSFCCCESLTSINIPNGVISIEEEAFVGCKKIETISIPKSVNEIGIGAFSYDENLTIIIVDPDNKSFDSRDNCNAIIDTQTNTLIAGCSSTIIPNSVIEIGVKAFVGSMLSGVIIPNSVKRIKEGAFFDCESLVEITIPESVIYIGEASFASCKKIETISIPKSVNEIGIGAFSYDENLTKIIVDPDNKSFDSRDNCNAIIDTQTNTLIAGCSSTIIPNDVMYIGEDAFRGCYRITSLNLPYGIINIGKGAFFKCTNLTSIAIPNSTIGIGDFAFSQCERLYSARLTDNIEKIGKGAFMSCRKLEFISIPTNIKEIGPRAFFGCDSLNTVVFPVNNVIVGESIFYGCKDVHIVIPKGTKDKYSVIFAQYKEKLVEQAYTNKVYDILSNAWTDDYGVKYSTDRKRLISAPIEITEYVVRGGTESIEDQAFCNHFVLSKITVPYTVKRIGNRAFWGCSNLGTISLPAYITHFGIQVFDGCGNLGKIIIPMGTKQKYERLLVGYKDKLVENNNGWKIKNIRCFTADETAAVVLAKVVPGQYGLSVQFNLASGSTTYIPLSTQSNLVVDDRVDLTTAKLITLCRDGDEDIYRVLE